MDWTNERYVRLYTRDTDDWLVLSWQAKALFPLMLRKVDRSGFLETKRGAVGVAAQTGLPLDVVSVGLPDLLRDGSVTDCDGGYLMPNYIDAQEAPQSDAQRAKELRERRRDRNRHTPSRNVTGDSNTPDRGTEVERETSDPASRSVMGPTQNVTDASRNAAKPSLQPDQPSIPASSNSRELTPAQRLVIAANQTFNQKFGEQTNPLTPQHGGTIDLVQRITEAGIPVDFAEQSVARQAGKARNPVKTMAYFALGIADDWAKRNAKLDAANAPRVIPLTRNGEPEQTRPRRGGSPPVDSDVKCFTCGTTETHMLNRRMVPKHKDDCPLHAAVQQVGH